MTGRHRIDPTQETVHISFRVPAALRGYLQRLGDGSLSLGLRRMYKLRAAVKDGEEAITMRLKDYVAIARELDRLRKAAK